MLESKSQSEASGMMHFLFGMVLMGAILLAPPLISGKEFYQSHLEMGRWIEKAFTIQTIDSVTNFIADVIDKVFMGGSDAVELFIGTPLKAMLNIGDNPDTTRKMKIIKERIKSGQFHK